MKHTVRQGTPGTAGTRSTTKRVASSQARLRPGTRGTEMVGKIPPSMRARKITADPAVTWSWRDMASDEALFAALEQQFRLKIGCRVREHISREFAVFGAWYSPGPTPTEITAARKRLVEGTQAYVRMLRDFRTSSDKAQQLAAEDLFFAAGEPKQAYRVEESPPDPPPISRIEVQLSQAILSLESRRRSRGRPKINRERVFCALYIAFEAGGGNPTANFNVLAGRIESKFVSFVQQLVSACPKQIRHAIGASIPSSIREQLRIWRNQPGRAGAPDHTMARQQLRYIAAPHRCAKAGLESGEFCTLRSGEFCTRTKPGTGKKLVAANPNN